MRVLTEYERSINITNIQELKNMELHDSFRERLKDGSYYVALRVPKGMIYMTDDSMKYVPFEPNSKELETLLLELLTK